MDWTYERHILLYTVTYDSVCDLTMQECPQIQALIQKICMEGWLPIINLTGVAG